jgi:hypothetical protein
VSDRLVSPLTIRRAVPEDATGIAAVLDIVARERIHSAIDRVWLRISHAAAGNALSVLENGVVFRRRFPNPARASVGAA